MIRTKYIPLTPADLATLSDFRLISMESRMAGILAWVDTGRKELLTSSRPKSTRRTLRESERWGIRITGALIPTLIPTRGDFSASWAMADLALSVTASEASRTFPLAASICPSNSATWKPLTYSYERQVFCLIRISTLTLKKLSFLQRYIFLIVYFLQHANMP